MLDSLTNVRITGILRGNSTAQARIEGRPCHTLIYKVNGTSTYYLRGDSITLSEGTVLYIPEGESYRFEKISEGESIYHLVNFHCDGAENEKPKLFLPSSTEHIAFVLQQMQRCWQLSNNAADRFEMLSHFYHLIHLLLKSQGKQYRTATQQEKIAPALEYLDSHLYQHELSVAALASLCGISEVTFRELFFSRFGVSPKKYIIRCRMMKARAMIEGGEFGSIGEVASAVGYEDPLYFSKHFRSHFGVSPSGLRADL